MRVLHSLRARVAASLAGIGSLVAAASVAIYGAYGKLNRVSEPVYGADISIQTGQWQVVPRRAWTASTPKVYGVPLKPGATALVVEADLTNRTAESSADYLGLLRWNAPPGSAAGKPMVVGLRDSQQMPYLQPGLPERMAFVWMLPPAAAVPMRTALAVQSKIYKPVDNLYGAPGWFNPANVGRIELPIAPGGAPESAP
ncbi:hypothetical protein [Achromobacter aegrifaciens]|uniref:hypothetical protein n=1 Tax=Achromobacter aegrifaciens TaxID=1287736 RepID=UPI001466FD2C|nr:hypothetical protein [Achromobacter aegrifaciens]CAB3652510.1 hypothetical protein LMG26852_02708 [Achromobacter aegrifaciens]